MRDNPPKGSPMYEAIYTAVRDELHEFWPSGRMIAEAIQQAVFDYLEKHGMNQDAEHH